MKNLMSTFLSTALIFGAALLSSCTESAQANSHEAQASFYSASLANGTASDYDEDEPQYEEEPQQEAKVYICTGPQSKRYHSDENCRGLGSCSKAIRCVSVEYAEKLGRTPCKMCH